MEEEGVEWDEITLASAIDACTKAKQGDRAHQLLQTMYKRHMTPEPMSITQVRAGWEGAERGGKPSSFSHSQQLSVSSSSPSVR
jgi:pentatricopeptide repeat protein